MAAEGSSLCVKAMLYLAELSRKENIAYLRDEAFKEQCECYKEYYGREPDTVNAKFTVDELFQKGYQAYLAEHAAKGNE